MEKKGCLQVNRHEKHVDIFLPVHCFHKLMLLPTEIGIIDKFKKVIFL